MSTKLHWVDGPWSGRLAIAARPRGGDWLEDEVAGWRHAGVNTVVSLLTPDEEENLDLKKEARLVKTNDMHFISYPIPDRQVPSSQGGLVATLDKINTHLNSGRNVLIHCRQGVGRSGLVAACLLIAKGWDPSLALECLSSVRGVPIPETTEQRRWIDQYAASLAGAK